MANPHETCDNVSKSLDSRYEYTISLISKGSFSKGLLYDASVSSAFDSVTGRLTARSLHQSRSHSVYSMIPASLGSALADDRAILDAVLALWVCLTDIMLMCDDGNEREDLGSRTMPIHTTAAVLTMRPHVPAPQLTIWHRVLICPRALKSWSYIVRGLTVLDGLKVESGQGSLGGLHP